MLRIKHKEEEEGKSKITDFKFGVIFVFCSVPFDFHFIIFSWELVKLGPAPISGYKCRGDDVSASEFSEGKDRAAPFFCCSVAFWKTTCNRERLQAEQRHK